VFVSQSTGTAPATSGAPVVNVFHGGFDGSGSVHAPLAIPASAPQYFGSGVYCYSGSGSFEGLSAANAVSPLAADDSIWVTAQNNLWVARTVATTTDFGCGSPLTVPAAGGTALVEFSGGGSCMSNALLNLPIAAVKQRLFRQGADGSLLFAVVYDGSIDFGGGALQSTGTSSLALARFDATGRLLASRTFGGSGSSFQLGSLAGNAAGTIILSSGFSGAVDLGGGPLPATGDTVLAAFDPTLQTTKWTRVVSVGGQGSLLATASPCGLYLATTSATLDLGTGPLSNGSSIGIAALGL
jgi:hypothetical protein